MTGTMIGTSTTVEPSGGERMSTSTAMRPPAPALFSTMTGRERLD
jgi:hypothetical protein